MTARDGSPIRAATLGAFWLATASLLTATHWPGLAIDGPVERTDLVVHAAVYAVWTGLLAAAYRPRVSVLFTLGILMAAADESTQPLFRRTFDALDLAADVFGVAAACCICLICNRLRGIARDDQNC